MSEKEQQYIKSAEICANTTSIKTYKKAIEYYEKTLQLNANNTVALKKLGWFYSDTAFLEITDINKAISYYERYINLCPKDYQVFIELAYLYMCDIQP